MSFMSDPQVPDPHAVATDNLNVSTVPVFAPPTAQVPTLSSLTPATAVHGTGAPVVVTVAGTNFVRGAVVNLNGVDVASSVYYSPTQMSFRLDPATVAAAGTQPVYVRNPTGGKSASVNFTFT